MDKKTLMRYCANLEQAASIRPLTYEDGRARGLRAVAVRNGVMEFTAMQDKCLDLASLTYKGVNLCPLAKPGLEGRNPYDTNGDEALRSIMLGCMFTCGFENIHGPRTVDGVDYPMHGRMRTTPMEKVSMDAAWEGDDYVLTLSGEGREAELFGENLVLRRKIRSVYGTSTIAITDEIENQAFRPEKLCFLYHVNAGFPFLQEGCRAVIPYVACTPRDDGAKAGLGHQMEVCAPRDNEPEQVFLYEMAHDAEGNTFAAIVNDDLGLALCLRWNASEIPYLTQWKSMASGDYVMALEPTNSGFDSREAADVEILQPLQTHVNHWSITVVDGKDAIAELDTACANLQKK